MITNCENCSQTLARLHASRETPGPAVGEVQHCPDCGDRRFVVHTGPKDCCCQRCEQERNEWTRTFCSCSCGNKRCPNSLDHRYECTGSNEPDQVGVLRG